MITIVLCETYRDVLEILSLPHLVIKEPYKTINRLHRKIETDSGNTYLIVNEPNHLLSIEAHNWIMTDACRFRKDLETFIKLAVSRCRLVE